MRLTLTHLDPLPDPYLTHTPWFVNPDADGEIYYEWFVPDQELRTSFELGAMGIHTSDYAVTYFMDASITNVTVNGSSFTIKGVETLGETELVIVNRWGARVYMNSNYDKKWDGVDDNEDPLPDGTYFFVLRPEKIKPVRGYVVVRR